MWIGKANHKLYAPNGDYSWLAQTLPVSEKGERISIRKKVFKAATDVVVLNTLDFLYGHVLLKLYNAIYHLDRGTEDLVVIVPGALEWLVPEGCAEVWVVDLRLSELVNRYQAISAFVTNELRRFRNVYLSKAWSHPDVARADIRRLTGVAPFDLGEFSQRAPTFTFVLREDRWWLPSSLWGPVFRGMRKLGIPGVGRTLMISMQERLVRQAIGIIQEELPHAKFVAAGLGKGGSLSDVLEDLRTDGVSNEVEVEWCRRYAATHVVIGVHGSNMLLPTALAAACVEILPEDRYGNMVQDISVRYNDRKQLFMYRFADEFSTAESVARKAVSIVRDFHTYNRNMCRNLY